MHRERVVAARDAELVQPLERAAGSARRSQDRLERVLGERRVREGPSYRSAIMNCAVILVSASVAAAGALQRVAGLGPDALRDEQPRHRSSAVASLGSASITRRTAGDAHAGVDCARAPVVLAAGTRAISVPSSEMPRGSRPAERLAEPVGEPLGSPASIPGEGARGGHAVGSARSASS